MFIEIALSTSYLFFSGAAQTISATRPTATAHMLCAAPLENKAKEESSDFYKHVTPGGVCDTPLRVARPICLCLPKAASRNDR